MFYHNKHRNQNMRTKEELTVAKNAKAGRQEGEMKGVARRKGSILKSCINMHDYKK